MGNLSSPLKYAHISKVIYETFSALSRHDLEACLVGSCAGMLHGMQHRLPKDVDVLVLNAPTEQSAEDIKQLLVSTDTRFSLVKSRVSGATHNVLWYALPSENRPRMPARLASKKEGGSSKPAGTERACKVDILLPGTLGIPLVPRAHLYFKPHWSYMAYFSSIPGNKPRPHRIFSLPFGTLLMTKLRAWVDHSLSTATEVMHERIPQDEEDIEELLGLSVSLGSQGVIRTSGGAETDAKVGGDLWMLGGFSDRTEARRSVREYTKKWPHTVNRWRDVGFS